MAYRAFAALGAASVFFQLGCSGPVVGSVPSPSTPSARPPASRAPAAPVPAAAMTTATATVRDIVGTRIGTVKFTDSYAGVIVAGSLSGLGLGAHGIHIHEIGKCEAPFTTAGGHFNPTNGHHGYRNPAGPHLGDMPNINTPAAGQLHFEFLLPGVTLTGNHRLLDVDGAAIVVHSGGDDYLSDPAGNSGSRIACGIIAAR
jgi:Cu-Zn family superoxide dismutase